MSTSTSSTLAFKTVTARGKPYIPALGPYLRTILAIIFASVALLGSTGVYLGAISFLNWFKDPQTYTSPFTLWMFIAHSIIGVIAILPFFVFGGWHLLTARSRPNRVAVRLGLVLFFVGGLVCLTGIGLIQLEGLPQLPTGTLSRSLVYWLHIVLPVVSIAVYVWHRKAGPRINWKWGYAWAGGTAAFVVAMIGLHNMDPRAWYAEGPKEGLQYFHPSESRTNNGQFIPEEVLMADEYCMQCHQDIYNDHLHSAHKFSSFNNPAYLFSVKETRKVGLERDGNVQASRWCAGCHDPVPFFSGKFDDPNFDFENHPTGHAGITCTACHAITNVNSVIGNGAYTIEEPQHYPLAFSKNADLQRLSNQVVKAKPDFHKKTFLKPFHKSAEFCSVCHKVGLPVALNHYKDFLRGQNHYDSYLLSGVSGHGSRAFYYPAVAKTNCAECHMPLKESTDFGAKDFDNSGKRSVHNHFFPAANTGLFELLKKEARYKDRSDFFDQSIAKNTNFLVGTDPEGKDKKLRIDIFGLKEGASTRSDRLIAPIRPQLPELKPGGKYLVEVVVRTLNVGHHFSQGTVDSNEIWVDFEAKSNGQTIARNGAMQNPQDDSGPLDEWAHKINVLMLDRNGKRIDRRNPQDIFTPLYDHQIPPGAANVMHYRLDIPDDVQGPIEIIARLRYRKFDYAYMEYVHKEKGAAVPKLPVVDICQDRVLLPVQGRAMNVPAQESPIKPTWQRWNDYGIANLIEGGVGNKRANYRQAEEAFQKLLTLGIEEAVPHGYTNLARVYFDEGRLTEAAEVLQKAKDVKAPWWTVAWFSAQVNSENATSKEQLDDVIINLERILDPKFVDPSRKFDFTQDYVVRNKLANILFKRAQVEAPGSQMEKSFLMRAIQEAEKVLNAEPEEVEAHDRLKQIYSYIATQANLPPPSLTTVEVDEVSEWGRQLADPKSSNRTELTAKLIEGWQKLDQDLNPNKPKLPILRAQIQLFRPVFHNEKDPTMQANLAVLMMTLHQISHNTYKPDEVARSRAARIYRESHPADNYAARDRVIYPTTPAQRETILKTGNLPEE